MDRSANLPNTGWLRVFLNVLLLPGDVFHYLKIKVLMLNNTLFIFTDSINNITFLDSAWRKLVTYTSRIWVIGVLPQKVQERRSLWAYWFGYWVSTSTDVATRHTCQYLLRIGLYRRTTQRVNLLKLSTCLYVRVRYVKENGTLGKSLAEGIVYLKTPGFRMFTRRSESCVTSPRLELNSRFWTNWLYTFLCE